MINHLHDRGEKSPRATPSGLFRRLNDLNIPSWTRSIFLSLAGPFSCRLTGGQDHRAPFMPGVDQLEEQPTSVFRERQVADLVHDQQPGAQQPRHAPLEGAICLGGSQGIDGLDQRREIHAAAARDRRHRQDWSPRCVLPTPGGPQNTTFSCRRRKPEVMQALELRAFHARLQG